MFSSIFAPFERLFALSRAQADNNTASAKLGQTQETETTTKLKARREYIDHLQIPPARKEVSLSELLQASRRKPGVDDFEVVPRTKGVLVLEEGADERGEEVEQEDWPRLAKEGKANTGLVEGRASYAQVTKASSVLVRS